MSLFLTILVIPRPRLGHKPNRDSERSHQIKLLKSHFVVLSYHYFRLCFLYLIIFLFFVTFTFNPKKVDRYSIESTSNIMKYWLNRQKNTSSIFAYVIVPESIKTVLSIFTLWFVIIMPDRSLLMFFRMVNASITLQVLPLVLLTPEEAWWWSN